MACVTNPAGQTIAVCNNVNGIAWPVDPGFIIPESDRAIFPTTIPGIDSIFVDTGGGACIYPVSDSGISGISGNHDLSFPFRVSSGLNITHPVWHVKFVVYGCFGMGGGTLEMRIGSTLAEDGWGNPTEYSVGDDTPYEYHAYWTLAPSGNPWEIDNNVLNLEAIFPRDWNINITSGSFDLRAAYLAVAYAPSTGPVADIEITGSGGMEIGGEAIITSLPLILTGSGGIEMGGNLDTNGLVMSADASGIYTLIPGQKFDRIYARNTEDDQTVDVAIPNPFGSTGYFGG